MDSLLAFEALSILPTGSGSSVRQTSVLSTQHHDRFAVLRPRAAQGSCRKRCCSSEAVGAAVHELQSGDTLSKNKPGLHMRTHACWGLNPLGRGARRYASPFPRVPLSLFPRPPTSGIVGQAGPMTSEGKPFSGPPKPSKDRGSPLLLGLAAK
jgi:hypothetical protein